MDKPSALLIYKGVPECYALCMEYVRFIYKVRSELRRVKSMPKEEKITRKEGVRAEVAPRSAKTFFKLAHDRFNRIVFSAAFAASIASCSPAVSQAQDTTSKKGKPVAAAVEKDKKAVEYVTVTQEDFEELGQFFKNAAGKEIILKPGETKEVGEYTIEAMKNASGMNGAAFILRVKDGDEKQLAPFTNPIDQVNILAIDMGDKSPYVKGTLLVLADNEQVYFQYFNKLTGKYELRGVPLWDGGMRPGSIQTGWNFDNMGIYVLSFPTMLSNGAVGYQAYLTKDGSSGGTFLRYVGPDTNTKLIAMK
jgi:hypothetical protein